MPEALVSVPSTVWNQLQWHTPATPALGSLRPAWAMTQKAKRKWRGKKKRAEVSFTFLVQAFIKHLLYTELRRETDVEDKRGAWIT